MFQLCSYNAWINRSQRVCRGDSRGLQLAHNLDIRVTDAPMSADGRLLRRGELLSCLEKGIGPSCWIELTHWHGLSYTSTFSIYLPSKVRVHRVHYSTGFRGIAFLSATVANQGNSQANRWCQIYCDPIIMSRLTNEFARSEWMISCNDSLATVVINPLLPYTIW